MRIEVNFILIFAEKSIDTQMPFQKDEDKKYYEHNPQAIIDSVKAGGSVIQQRERIDNGKLSPTLYSHRIDKSVLQQLFDVPQHICDGGFFPKIYF